VDSGHKWKIYQPGLNTTPQRIAVNPVTGLQYPAVLIGALAPGVGNPLEALLIAGTPGVPQGLTTVQRLLPGLDSALRGIRSATARLRSSEVLESPLCHRPRSTPASNPNPVRLPGFNTSVFLAAARGIELRIA
jgi:hypothetical protein